MIPLMLVPGRTLSHYRILERIGVGGMGEVYKALDTRLDRTVALKILPKDGVGDPDRRSRFMQEARAASALDHPNIVVVHDIGEEDGVHFIAMQYVSGATLRERVGRMKLSEALGCAIQMADALAAAHSHGIVHRDLKPENVVVTEQGAPKILDFGVAKLTEPGNSEDAPTRDQNARLTREGHVVGTAAYMSPEQAEGRNVDARSDIFSFGSVLYEMVTGKRAFDGANVSSILASVLKEEPKPLRALMPNAPLELERVLTRALRKDPARRFQTMADLKVALEDLRSEVDSGVAVTASDRVVRKPVPLWAWVGGAVAVALAAFVYVRYGRTESDSLPLPRAVPLTTAAGNEWDPALSPDGRQVAFTTDRDLYVRLIDGGQELRLTDNVELEVSPAWSADGSRIAYIRDVQEEGELRPAIFVISALGGPETRLGTARGSWQHGVSWSPDGRELALVSAERTSDVHAIYLLSLDSREMRKLTDPPQDCKRLLVDCGDFSPVFSPDGRTLAFLRISSHPAIYTIAPDGGGLKRLTKAEDERLKPDESLAWAPDGKSLVVSERGNGFKRVAASGGELEPITFIEQGAREPSISRQGNRLVYQRRLSDLNVWEIPGPRAKKEAPPRKLIASTRDDRFARNSPDGKQMAFVSNRSGANELWICDADGQNARKPFPTSNALMADWSPDGKWLLFSQEYGDAYDLFVGSVDGGAPRRLTELGGDFAGGGDWSRDGKWVYFTRNPRNNSPQEVWRIPSAGGEAIQVTRGGGWFGRESADPRYVLFTRETGIWRVPVEGGAEEKLIETGTLVDWQWDAFEGGVCYADNLEDRSHLRCHDLVSGKVTDLATLEEDIIDLTVSADGEWVFVTRQDASGADLMLVENFR